MKNYRKLHPRLKRFAEAIADGLSAADAARLIKPTSKSPKRLGYRLRHYPDVAAAIADLDEARRQAYQDRRGRHEDGVFNRAHADRSVLLDQQWLKDNPVATWPQGLKDCIESVEYTDLGNIKKITLSNRNDASRLVAQMGGWLTEKHEVTGSGPVYIIQRAEAEKIEKDLDESV